MGVFGQFWMAPVVILLLITISFSSVAGLKCWKCEKDQCQQQNKDQWKEMECADTKEAGAELISACGKYSRANETSTSLFARGCAHVTSKELDDCMRGDGVESCHCNTDLCNGSLPLHHNHSSSTLLLQFTLLAAALTTRKSKLLVFIMLITFGLASLSSVEGLSCWVCVEKPCGVEVEWTEEECNERQIACVTIYKNDKNDKNDKNKTGNEKFYPYRRSCDLLRGTSAKKPLPHCYKNDQVEYCYCNTDFCNGASPQGRSASSNATSASLLHTPLPPLALATLLHLTLAASFYSCFWRH